MALSSTLPTGTEAACGANRRPGWASVASMPRMRSTTRRAFMGVTRVYRAWAPGSMVVPSVTYVSECDPLLAALRLPVFLDVTPEGARRRELAQLVADHRLGDEHRNVGLAVVHRDRVAGPGRGEVGRA